MNDTNETLKFAVRLLDIATLNECTNQVADSITEVVKDMLKNEL